MDHDSHNEPSQYSKVFSFVGVLGSMLLFLVILMITYIPSDKEPVGANVSSLREATLEENSAADRRKLNEVKAVDPVAGIYKIPVSDAIELTVAKLEGAAR
ncbi:MAG: hypothetical protein ACPGN3_07895 [Opitutales bacterium]